MQSCCLANWSQVEEVLDWSLDAHLQSLHCSQGEEGVPLDVEDLVLGALEPRLARCCLTWLPARLLLPPPRHQRQSSYQRRCCPSSSSSSSSSSHSCLLSSLHPFTHNRLFEDGKSGPFRGKMQATFVIGKHQLKWKHFFCQRPTVRISQIKK